MCPAQSGGFLPTPPSGKSAGEVWSQGDLSKYQKRESQKLLLLWVFFFFSALSINVKKLCSLLKRIPSPDGRELLIMVVIHVVWHLNNLSFG